MHTVCNCYAVATFHFHLSRILFARLTQLAVSQKKSQCILGIVWRDKIYGDRRQICERVEVSTIKINFLDYQTTKNEISPFYIKHLI
jgi:hypothetical protein